MSAWINDRFVSLGLNKKMNLESQSRSLFVFVFLFIPGIVSGIVLLKSYLKLPVDVLFYAK